MPGDAQRRPDVNRDGAGMAGEANDQRTQLDDIWAWTGVFVGDGRMVSLAWLRGYVGAVASTGARRG